MGMGLSGGMGMGLGGMGLGGGMGGFGEFIRQRREQREREEEEKKKAENSDEKDATQTEMETESTTSAGASNVQASGEERMDTDMPPPAKKPSLDPAETPTNSDQSTGMCVHSICVHMDIMYMYTSSYLPLYVVKQAYRDFQVACHPSNMQKAKYLK